MLLNLNITLISNKLASKIPAEPVSPLPSENTATESNTETTSEPITTTVITENQNLETHPDGVESAGEELKEEVPCTNECKEEGLGDCKEEKEEIEKKEKREEEDKQSEPSAEKLNTMASEEAPKLPEEQVHQILELMIDILGTNTNHTQNNNEQSDTIDNREDVVDL